MQNDSFHVSVPKNIRSLTKQIKEKDTSDIPNWHWIEIDNSQSAVAISLSGGM